MQAFFDLCKRDEIRQAHDFSNEFQVELTKLPDVAGTSGDYEVTNGTCPQFPTGTVVEFKYDVSSKKTGNVFVEFQQTSDNWFQSRTSGIKLAMENNQIGVISVPTRVGNGCDNYIIKNMAEYDSLVQNSHRTITTRACINGNHRGCYARGHLVRLSILEKLVESFKS